MGEAGENVVLKWPNDIYAKVKGGGREELRKIGGILINTVFMSGGVRIIAGRSPSFRFSAFGSTGQFHRMWSQCAEQTSNPLAFPN